MVKFLLTALLVLLTATALPLTSTGAEPDCTPTPAATAMDAGGYFSVSPLTTPASAPLRHQWIPVVLKGE